MQMLAHLKVDDYATWRRVFDDNAEARGDAGLTLLQLWREANDENVVWMLYEVSDRTMAEGYLEGVGLLHAEQGGATVAAHCFLRTA